MDRFDTANYNEATNKQMTTEYLEQLNAAATYLIAQPEIRNLISLLKEKLKRVPEPFVWSTFDLESVGTCPPEKIKSGWIFVLKKDVPSGCHYHPNSTQHMVMIEGQGESNVGGVRKRMIQFGSDQHSLDHVWYVIPEHTEHEFFPQDRDMVVISFHTCAATQLEEINCNTGANRLYEPG